MLKQVASRIRAEIRATNVRNPRLDRVYMLFNTPGSIFLSARNNTHSEAGTLRSTILALLELPDYRVDDTPSVQVRYTPSAPAS